MHTTAVRRGVHEVHTDAHTHTHTHTQHTHTHMQEGCTHPVYHRPVHRRSQCSPTLAPVSARRGGCSPGHHLRGLVVGHCSAPQLPPWQARRPSPTHSPVSTWRLPRSHTHLGQNHRVLVLPTASSVRKCSLPLPSSRAVTTFRSRATAYCDLASLILSPLGSGKEPRHPPVPHFSACAIIDALTFVASMAPYWGISVQSGYTHHCRVYVIYTYTLNYTLEINVKQHAWTLSLA